MKVEFADVSETRKRLTIEIPSDAVDAEIDRLIAPAGPVGQGARVPARARCRRASSGSASRTRSCTTSRTTWCRRRSTSALRERDLEPVDTPDVRDVVVEQGTPLTFVATFDTVPAFDPGEYRGRRAAQAGRRRSTDDGGGRGARAAAAARRAVRAGRGAPARGDRLGDGRSRAAACWAASRPAAPERHENVTIDLGAEANPPGFSEHLVGPRGRARTRTSPWHYPADHPVEGPGRAGRSSTASRSRPSSSGWCRRWTTSSRRTSGSFDSLAALRDRVRQDLEHEAAHEADRAVRGDLLADLAEAGALRGARRARRAGARPARRGVRAAAGRAAGRSAQGRDRLERVPHGAARRGGRVGEGDGGPRRDRAARAGGGERRGPGAGDRAVRRAQRPHGRGGARAAREGQRPGAPARRPAPREDDGPAAGERQHHEHRTGFITCVRRPASAARTGDDTAVRGTAS